MDESWEQVIGEVDGVAEVSPQLFIASLRTGCCSARIQLMGFDPDSDFVVAPWIASTLPGPLAEDEIVVGSAITAEVGERLRFFDRSYTVAARMDETGGGFDTSVFLTMSAARVAARDRAEVTDREAIPDDAISALIVNVADGTSPEETAEQIAEAHGGPDGVVAVASDVILAKVSTGLNALATMLAALVVVLWLFSVIVLGIVVAAMLNERRREFGILRSLGATGARLAGLVMLESGLVSLWGAIGGVFLALLVVLPFRTAIGRIADLPYIQPSWPWIGTIVAGSLLAMTSIGPIAAAVSAWRLAKKDSYSVIRQEGL
jgi:putative ABC transport system permease protein